MDSMKRYNPDVRFGQVDIYVYHHGYTKERVIRKHKSARNIPLLLQELVDDPSRYLYHFYLGLELYYNDQLDDALEHLNTYVAGVRAHV